MYGPDLTELLGHIGHGVPTPADDLQPETAAVFAVFDSVRDSAQLIGNDMIVDWCEQLSISDENIVATLAMLEAVPQAVVPQADPYLDRWRDENGDRVVAGLATAYGVDVDLLTGMPIPPASDAPQHEVDRWEEAVFRLQMSLVEASGIAMTCVVEPFQHWIAHVADDLGFVFQTTADDPFRP